MGGRLWCNSAEQIATWLNEQRYEEQWNMPEEKFPRLGPRNKMLKLGCEMSHLVHLIKKRT